MADDIRTRLSEALDEAEKRAQGLLDIAQQVRQELGDPKLLGTRIPGWGAWTAVEAMCERELRSVERDRQLLADHQPVMVNLPSGNTVVEAERCTGCSMYPGDWKHPIPCPEVERAVAFWLGTQDGGS